MPVPAHAGAPAHFLVLDRQKVVLLLPPGPVL